MHASYSTIDLCKQIQILDFRDNLMWTDKSLISISQSLMNYMQNAILYKKCLYNFKLTRKNKQFYRKFYDE